LADVFYVDIGAHHPVHLSNTYLFYCHGARGITVEPNREMARHHRRKRPRDKLIEAAVSTDGKPTITFHNFEPSTMSTADAEQAENLIKAGKFKLVSTETVPTVQPEDIATVIDSRTVNLLSIDIEGDQLKVIEQIFAAGIRPNFVCCETIRYDGRVEVCRDEATIVFLQDSGYAVIGDTLINTIFADRSVLPYRLI